MFALLKPNDRCLALNIVNNWASYVSIFLIIGMIIAEGKL